MRPANYKIFFSFSLFFLGLFLLSQKAAAPLRTGAISSFIYPMREIKSLIGSIPSSKNSFFSQQELPRLKELELENHQLKQQLKEIKAYFSSEERIDELLEKAALFQEAGLKTASLKPFYERRYRELLDCLEKQLVSAPAKVIYREPSSWNHFIWVDAGKKTNRLYKREIVAKNSPVVVGNSIIGVVESVHESKSKIRLITDPALSIAVRVVRGREQHWDLGKQLDRILKELGLKESLFLKEQKEVLFDNLKQVRDHLLSVDQKDFYLAKGVLKGMKSPLWRKPQPLLKGIGFNYDYGDQEGPSRELRTGKRLDGEKELEAQDLIKQGDHLMTTGFDGIFPSGFYAAIVHSVSPLEEGGCTYEIDALLSTGSLDDLKDVWILPPLEENMTRMKENFDDSARF